MADSKITALTALTAADPTVDMFPVVDVSDTTMAASGTTKRISINNILACSPSATLASATISGDLTVDTSTLKVDSANNRVGIGTATPLNAAHIQGTGQATVTPTVTGDGSALSLIDSATAANNGGMLVLGANSVNGFFGQVAIKSLLTNGLQNGTSDLAIFTRAATSDTTLAERFRIAQGGICTWSNVGGGAGTAMTLNSTGLLVGTTATGYGAAGRGLVVAGGSTSAVLGLRVGSLDAGYLIASTTRVEIGGSGTTPIVINNGGDAIIVDTSRNVGIGVTPSAIAGQTRIELKGSNGAGYVIRSDSTNTAARDWVIAANVTAFGDFVIRQGNSQGAEPIS